MSTWSGRKVARLRTFVLTTKGTTCHLCGLPGANSPDHDPPRSVLVASGVTNPDDPRYLFPAHLTCSQLRGTRPITPELRAECRRDRERREGRVTEALSPRFARRRSLRPDFLRASDPGGRTPAASIPEDRQKNAEER